MNKEIEEQLIEEVRSRPSLYNPADAEYYNQIKKEVVARNIVRAVVLRYHTMKLGGPSFNPNEMLLL